MAESYLKSFSLKGKTALVTGAVGILGKHFCKGLAESGANIGVIDLDASACESFAQELSKAYDIKACGLACDVSNEQQVAKTLETAIKRLGPIHILHNNAATKTDDVQNFFKKNSEFRMEDWRNVMSVNVDGMFLMARAVGQSMIQNNVQGSIIQTGSIYGVMAPDFRIYEGSEYQGSKITTPAVYSASKAAVVGLTRYLSSLWGPHGIRVNTLVPGGVQSGQNKVFFDKYSARVPLGRMAQAQEMVGTLIYLASDASSYVTGQTLMVDGGLSAW